MKLLSFSSIAGLSLVAVILSLTGCATTSSTDSFPRRYHAMDGRVVDIGERAKSDSGWDFKDPHLKKCWIADGFDFNGYDTLLIAPTLSVAKLSGPEQEGFQQIAKETLVAELTRLIRNPKIFTNIVTRESDLPPGARVLKLENTITEYAKGGAAARYWFGLFGGGQPVLRVEGKMTDSGKPVFTFDGRRSASTAGAYLNGGIWMTDVDIQTEDIRNLSRDITDFMAAISGKYQPAK